MAVQVLGKVVRLPDGSDAGPYEIVSGLTPAQEAALIQGGDAVALGARGLVPAFFDVSTPSSPKLLNPDGSQASVSGGAVGTVPAAQIIAGTLGSYTADTTYITADTAGGVERGTLIRWDTSMAAWVFDFYRSAKVL